MGTLIHCQIDIKGAILNSFCGLLDGTGENALDYFTENGEPVDPVAALRDLLDRLNRGERFMPLGECDGFDPRTGCPGHEEVQP